MVRHICIYVYIHIYRERERGIESCHILVRKSIRVSSTALRTTTSAIECCPLVVWLQPLGYGILGFTLACRLKLSWHLCSMRLYMNQCKQPKTVTDADCTC